MRDMSPPRNSSLRVFFARQIQQLLVLCLICGALFVSFHTFTSKPPELLIQSEKFPRKIWQSWKVDPTRFEHRDNERARTWTVKNPGHRYEVLTDDNADYYVEHHFGPLGLNRPDIVNVYKSLNAKIIKSDLLRYLIMYVEGGVYADIDVEAIRPVKKFVPKAFDEANIDMVVGIEVDEPDFASHPVLGSKAQSFCQWTFMCKPRLPVMLRLIEHIMMWLHELSLKQGKPISELYLDFNEVLSGTGPSAFTAAILAEMTKTVGEPVTWDRFHGLTEAKLVGGVLVLTVEAFAAGTGHSDSGNHGGKGAMVKHHFHASSWPSNHPRFKHPVYGEVEKCNWNMECVKLWDANSAFFDALPEAERLKIIGLKELQDAKKAGPPLAPIAGTPEQIQLIPNIPTPGDSSEQAGAALDSVSDTTEQLQLAPIMGAVAESTDQLGSVSDSGKDTTDQFQLLDAAQHDQSESSSEKDDSGWSSHPAVSDLSTEGKADKLQNSKDVQSEQPTSEASDSMPVSQDIFIAAEYSDLKARDLTPEEPGLEPGLTPGLTL